MRVTIFLFLPFPLTHPSVVKEETLNFPLCFSHAGDVWMELLLLQNLYSGVGREFGWNMLPCSHVSVGKGAGREILKFYLPEKERLYLLK